MRPQCSGRPGAGRPPPETSLRQSFGRQPESLAVIGEDANGGSTPGPEDKQTSGKGIGTQLLPAELRQSIHALAAVDRLDRDQDAELRRDLNHEAGSSSARLSSARSAALAPLQWIRILPWRPSSSMVHSSGPVGRGATSSTKAGGMALSTLTPAATIRRFSLPPSRCSAAAVRLMPSRRATAIAADHSSSGIRAFPCRFCRHCPNRLRTSSTLAIEALRAILIPPGDTTAEERR